MTSWPKTLPARPRFAPLIYLDFDGVLHPSSSPPQRLFENLPRLQALMRSYPSADVVLSTSWRLHRSRDALLRPFAPDLRSRIVGMTGDAGVGIWARWHEVHAHWNRHGDMRPWRALDDAAWEFPPDCRALLRCDPEIGFGEAQELELETWLCAMRGLEQAHAQPLPAPDAELLQRADRLLQQHSDASVAFLQRQLRIGYRAALGLQLALEGQFFNAPDSEGRRSRLQ